FAALPTAGLTGAAPVLLAVPLLVGVVVGADQVRRSLRGSAPTRSWREVLVAIVLTGPVAGALLLALARASAGALGSDRLATLGPADWRIGVFTALVVGLGSLIGAALAAAPARRPTGRGGGRPAPREPIRCALARSDVSWLGQMPVGSEVRCQSAVRSDASRQ